MRYTQTGLISCAPDKATPGYTLFSPLYHRTSYLIDLAGNVVHQWALPGEPGNYARLLPNGNLFAACADNVSTLPFNAKGGRMVELDWNGNIVWEYIDSNQHHDFHRKANGNTIYLAWEKLPAHLAARVRGGRPGSELNGQIYSEYIREVTPDRKSTRLNSSH